MIQNVQRTIQVGPNGRGPDSEFEEKGTVGLNTWGGFINQAYNAELYWPGVEPTYSKMWRSDPEVTIARTVFTSLAGNLHPTWELPQQIGGKDLGEPNDADKRALDFAFEVADDIEGGLDEWLSSALARVPFFGWGWWETPMGKRDPNWKPPDDDPWRSNYSDGLIGYRRLAWRDYGSLEKWEQDDHTGRLYGMWQNDPPNAPILLPLSNSLHITFGDHDNPEGLATLEAMWRLERIKFGLEVVYGIGAEHAAGYLDIKKDESGAISDADYTHIRRQARAVLSAQEGNYAVWPAGYTGEVKSIPFPAAGDLLEAIKYWGVLKLSLLGMQWVALSATTGAGSYAAMDDSSSMMLLIYNNLAESLIKQADQQIGKRLFDLPANRDAFAGMTRRPVLTVNRIEKTAGLIDLAQFSQAMKAVMPLGDDDYIAIRRESNLLPESLPEVETPTGDGTMTVPSIPGMSGSADAPENIESTAGLNGAQITAVLSVLEKMAAGVLTGVAATELLIAVGLQRDRAERIVSEAQSAQPEPEPEPEPNPFDEEDEEDEEGELAMTDEGKWYPGKHTAAPIDITVDDESLDDPEDIRRLIKDVEKWAKANDLDLDQLLNADIDDGDNDTTA